jgi:hypothetical protein
VLSPRVEENALGGCGLARIDMSGDPDVSDIFQIEFRHDFRLPGAGSSCAASSRVYQR